MSTADRLLSQVPKNAVMINFQSSLEKIPLGKFKASYYIAETLLLL